MGATQKLLDAVPALIRDLAGVLGAGLVVYGTWRIYPPAGCIVAGVLLLAGSLLLARAGSAE